MTYRAILCAAALLLSAACRNTVPAHSTSLATRPQLLQGIWALDSTENALFFINARAVVFVEHQDEPVRYRLAGDTLVLRFSRQLIIHDLILKLDPDSLVLRSESGVVSHLYRRTPERP